MNPAILQGFIISLHAYDRFYAANCMAQVLRNTISPHGMDEIVWESPVTEILNCAAKSATCPQQRNAPDEPVGYEAVNYTLEAANIMFRLQREFHLALQQLAEKDRPQGEASVIKFNGHRKTPRIRS